MFHNFPPEMATSLNKRKLAAVAGYNSQSQNSALPRINEEYATQMPEEVEGRVTKKLSKEFSKT